MMSWFAFWRRNDDAERAQAEERERIRREQADIEARIRRLEMIRDLRTRQQRSAGR